MTDNYVHSTLFFNYLKRTRNVLILLNIVILLHFLLLFVFPGKAALFTDIIWILSELIMIIYVVLAFRAVRGIDEKAWLSIVFYGFFNLAAILLKSYYDFIFSEFTDIILFNHLIAMGNMAIILAFFLFSRSGESLFKIRRELNLIGLILLTIVVISCLKNYKALSGAESYKALIRSITAGVINLSPFALGLGIYWMSIWKKDMKRRAVFLIMLFSTFITFIINNFHYSGIHLYNYGLDVNFSDIMTTVTILLFAFAAWNEVNVTELPQNKTGYRLFYVSRIERIIPIISIMLMLITVYYNRSKLDDFLIVVLLVLMIPYNIIFLFFELYSYRSEDAVLAVLSVSPVGVHITDREFRKTYFVNKSLFDIFRSDTISPDMITGNKIPEVLKNKIIRSIAENKTLEKIETVLIRPDGTKFNAECRIIPGRYYSYDIVISWIWDVTERKKYEGSILQQKYSAEIASLYKSELLDNLSNRIQSGYVTMKYENNGWPDFALTGINKRIPELFNISENLIRMKLRQVFPDPEPGLIAKFFEVLSTGISVKRELYFKEIDKIFLFLIFRISADEIACLIDDITESKNKEKELVERERELSTLLKNLPGMAYRCKSDQGWAMLFVSEGSMDLSGYKPEELIEGGGVSWSDLVHPDDREMMWRGSQNELMNRKSYYLSYRIITKDSSVKYVWEKGVGVYDNENLLFLEGFIFDITKQKEAEAVLREHVMKESEVDKARALRQMAGGIAHDLNNRLMGIGSYNSLIELKVKDKNIKKYTEGIQNSILESTELIEDLLIFARQSDIITDTFSINTMLRDIALNAAGEFSENIKINSVLTAEKDFIKGDYRQINKAFYDIVSNAKDAMPDGGTIVIRTENKTIDKISLSDLTGGDSKKMFIVIKISDSGLGIEAENLNRIFDPFYTTKPVGKGKGLGLSAVYGTIQAHKGAVTVESTPGKGTSFSIYLPVA